MTSDVYDPGPHGMGETRAGRDAEDRAVTLLMEALLRPGTLDVFEKAVIERLHSALIASQMCEPGVRLDSLAMTLKDLAVQCEGYANSIAKLDTLSPQAGAATALTLAASLSAQQVARAAKSVAEVVRNRAVSVDSAAVESLWKTR